MRKKSASRWASALFVGTLCVMTFSTLMADDARPPWVAPARAARKKNPIPADDKSIAAGKAVYIAQCLKCHGDAGKGDGPSAKDLDPRPKDLSEATIASQTDGSMFWKITTGRKPMPSFENLISDDDRWNVINYVRTLEPPPSSQPATQP
jgi:mono/diheme cytochrome c family protein